MKYILYIALLLATVPCQAQDNKHWAEDSVRGPGDRYVALILQSRQDVNEGQTKIKLKDNPLYIVDGTIWTKGASAFSVIDPQNIGTIKVLKSADAIGKYGSIGANGAIIITTTKATSTAEEPKKMNPYVSAGASVGERTLSYAIEEGFYNHNWWVAITEELDRDAFGHLTQVYIGPKIYKALVDISPNSQLFAYAAIKDNVRYHDLILEPGLAYVFLSSAKWALQISASTPIYEGQKLGNPTNLSTGLSVNYWIK